MVTHSLAALLPELCKAMTVQAAGIFLMLHSATVKNGEYFYDYAWKGHKASGIYFAVVHGKKPDGPHFTLRLSLESSPGFP